MHREVLHMAGQLGLDPPTMTLCSGGPAIEVEQALLNSEAIANCFNGSLASSLILLVVYCASSLRFHERKEIQHKIESFFERVYDSTEVKRVSDPVFLYILAPALPKGYMIICHACCYSSVSYLFVIMTRACFPGLLWK